MVPKTISFYKSVFIQSFFNHIFFRYLISLLNKYIDIKISSISIIKKDFFGYGCSLKKIKYIKKKKELEICTL